MTVEEVVTGVGSAMFGRRRSLGRLLADPGAVGIVTGHRGRLAWFGGGHLWAALAAEGRQVMIVGSGELGEDLARDMSEVLTSLCAGRYGQRGARRRVLGARGWVRSLAAGSTGG